MPYFATFFDKNYLSRGIVLYQSLQKQQIAFQLFVLCLDDETAVFFETNKSIYSNVIALHIKELEHADKDLFQAKQNRNIVEYYFTLSPCLPLYLLQKFNLPHICTLDADIFFFSSPEPLFNNLNNYSIIITPHKFSTEAEHLSCYGIYNVSFQIFKNDQWGMQCLNKWRSQCLNWCYDYMDEETGLFADQKYLDTWTTDYLGKVKVLDDNCSGIAPWNLNRFPVSYLNGLFEVQGNALVYYHYQHFKILNIWHATNGFNIYKTFVTVSVKKLYALYWKKIEKINKQLSIQQDTSQRVNLSKKPMMKIIEEKQSFFRLAGNILNLNISKWSPIVTRTIRKIYG